MWDRLTKADIETARRELGFRRAEMVRRHAEEIELLEAECADIAALSRLAGTFAAKFARNPGLPEPPGAGAGAPSPLATGGAPLEPPRRPRMDYPKTNFDTFYRAITKAIF